MADITPPEKLTPAHNIAEFACSEPSLDDWLKKHALANEASGASRTYVVSAGGRRVVGYYALATGAVNAAEATGKVRRNCPDPIPVMVLSRLAVDEECDGKGVGSGLLKDAVLRVIQASEIVGIRAILVHAISEDAKKFYERKGFAASPLNPMTLMISLKDAKKNANLIPAE
jgi:GNAT superfamily N-acetyltransferase